MKHGMYKNAAIWCSDLPVMVEDLERLTDAQDLTSALEVVGKTMTSAAGGEGREAEACKKSNDS